MRARAEPVSRSTCGTRGAAARFRSVMGLFSRHRRGPSMGQPLLDQGADALDIMPPTPEELPPDTDAPFEVRHAARWRRVPRGPRVPHATAPSPPQAMAGARARSSVASPVILVARDLDADPTRSDRLLLARSPPTTRRRSGCAGTASAPLRSDAAPAARRSSRTRTRCASKRSRSTSGDSPSP